MRGLAIYFAVAIFAMGCVQVKPLRERVAQQEAVITKLREDNAQFQKNYYQIKEMLDSESADKEKQLSGLQRELDKSQNLKTQKERELSDELNVVRLQFKAFREETAEQQKANEAAAERLRQNVSELTAERDAALKKFAELDAQHRVQQQRLDEMTKETADLRVNLKTVQAQADSLGKERAALQQSLQAEQKTRADAEQKLKASQDDNAQAQKQLAAAAADLKAARAEGDRTRQESRKQLEKMKRDLDASSAERKMLAEKADSPKMQPRANAADDPELKAAADKLRQRLSGVEAAKGADVRVDGRGLRIILPSDRLFQEKSIILASQAKPVLDRVGEVLGSLSGHPIKIEGHTDSEPVQDLPFVDNWGLGFARADRVRDYLMRSAKLSAKNVTALSRADLDPIGTTAAANRRVEIVVGK